MSIRKIIRSALLKHRQEERYILERKIFPKIMNKNILFVGVANYTQDYPKRLELNNLWTLDINPQMAGYGAKGKHKVLDVMLVDKNYDKNFFDIVFLSGIFGYGVDDEKSAEKVLVGVHKILKNNGMLIVLNSLKKKNDKVQVESLPSYSKFKNVEYLGMKSPFKTKKRKRIFYFLEKSEN